MLNGKVGKVENLEATVAQQQKQIETLMARVREQAAQIQKVSAQLEASKRAPQISTIARAASAPTKQKHRPAATITLECVCAADGSALASIYRSGLHALRLTALCD